MRTRCIRERAAQRPSVAHPPSSVRRGPDSERIRAFFISDSNRPAHRRRPAIDGSHRRQRWTLFNNLLRDDLGTGRWFVSQIADVAQQAERDHAMVEATSSRLVIRSTSGVPMHSAVACHGVGGAGCARYWPGPVQRDTRPTGRSRVGTAEVDRRVRLAGRTPLFQGDDAGSSPAHDTRPR